MKNQTLNGIGCFAKPERLSRIFLRLVQSYALGQLEGIKLVDRFKSVEKEGAGLLKALITGKAAWQESSQLSTRAGVENKIITGFYLSLKGHCLELSIFSKNDSRLERHSALLEEFTRLRQKRLN